MSFSEPDLLDLLVAHELAIKNLYGRYAVLFPNLKQFWNSIAGEEHRHAILLEKLRSAPDFDTWLRRCPFKSQAIVLSTDYINGLAAQAKNGNVTLADALSYAMDIEKALIEKVFSEIDNSFSDEIILVLESIGSDTARHRNLISETLESSQ